MTRPARSATRFADNPPWPNLPDPEPTPPDDKWVVIVNRAVPRGRPVAIPPTAGGPVNRTCALCGTSTAGALCSRCVWLPGRIVTAAFTRLVRAVVPAVAVPVLAGVGLAALTVGAGAPSGPAATCSGCARQCAASPNPNSPDICATCASGGVSPQPVTRRRGR